MKKILSILLAIGIVGLVVFSSSDSFSKLINKKWPPISSLDQRYESVLTSTETVSQKEFSSDILLSISESDLKDQALPLIDKEKGKISDLSIDGISSLKINEVDLSLLNQGITTTLNIEFKINSLDLLIKAVVSGDVSIVVKDDGVLLKPALTYIQINPVNPVKDRWLLLTNSKEALVANVSALLERLLNNINGAIFENGFHIPFELYMAEKFSPKDIEKKDNINISGDDVPLNLSLPTLAVYISDSSFKVLASSSNINKVRKERPKSTITEKDFNDAFTELERIIGKILAASFGDEYLSIGDDVSVVLLRKIYLANLINESLENLNITISAKDFITIPKPGDPEGKNKFSQDIAVHDKQKLPSCNGLYRDFKGEACDNPCSYSHLKCDNPCSYSHINCDVHCSLSNCDYGCKAYRPDRCAREAACKVARETKRAACDAKKAACKIDRETRRENCKRKNTECKIDRETRRENCKRKNTECKMERETKRIAHQAENEARVAKCKTKRAALKLVDGLVKLGEISGEYWVSNSHLKSSIKSIRVSDDLSEIKVNSDIDVSLDARLRVWVNPEGLGHIACVFSFRKTLETHATYHNPNQYFEGGIAHKHKDGVLTLIGKTKPVNLTANLSPSPYSQLIQDQDFY